MKAFTRMGALAPATTVLVSLVAVAACSSKPAQETPVSVTRSAPAAGAPAPADAKPAARAAIGVADLGPGVKLEMTAIAARSPQA